MKIRLTRFFTDLEHRTGQLALYCVLFSRKERKDHAKEEKESQTLSLPALLDALDDIEALDYGRAKGIIDDENDKEGGVPLVLPIGHHAEHMDTS